MNNVIVYYFQAHTQHCTVVPCNMSNKKYWPCCNSVKQFESLCPTFIHNLSEIQTQCSVYSKERHRFTLCLSSSLNDVVPRPQVGASDKTLIINLYLWNNRLFGLYLQQMLCSESSSVWCHCPHCCNVTSLIPCDICSKVARERRLDLLFQNWSSLLRDLWTFEVHDIRNL